MRKNHFFMFRGLQNNVRCFFYKQHLYKENHRDLCRNNNNLRYQKEKKT